MSSNVPAACILSFHHFIVDTSTFGVGIFKFDRIESGHAIITDLNLFDIPILPITFGLSVIDDLNVLTDIVCHLYNRLYCD
jgi:hypothetical protein